MDNIFKAVWMIYKREGFETSEMDTFNRHRIEFKWSFMKTSLSLKPLEDWTATKIHWTEDKREARQFASYHDALRVARYFPGSKPGKFTPC